MTLASPDPTTKARGLSLDWASFLVAMVLAAFVRLGVLGNVPW
jgi:hypothetical protein